MSKNIAPLEVQIFIPIILALVSKNRNTVPGGNKAAPQLSLSIFSTICIVNTPFLISDWFVYTYLLRQSCSTWDMNIIMHMLIQQLIPDGCQ